MQSFDVACGWRLTFHSRGLCRPRFLRPCRQFHEVGFLKVTWRLCRLFRFSQRLVWPLHFQGVSSSLDLVWTLTHYRRWFGHPVRQP
jgi:hypothetical protein